MITHHYPGHRYEIDHLDGKGSTIIQFVQREPLHESQSGILCQDLLHVMIDRIAYLDDEVPSPINQELIHHARIMLALFEARALVRKVELGKIHPENLALGEDRHLLLTWERS